MEFDERWLDFLAGGRLAVGPQRGERHGIGPSRIVAFAEDRSQQGIQTFKQFLVGAEGQVEVDQRPTRSLDISLHLAKDGHIGVSEAVDGLFGCRRR